MAPLRGHFFIWLILRRDLQEVLFVLNEQYFVRGIRRPIFFVVLIATFHYANVSDIVSGPEHQTVLECQRWLLYTSGLGSIT
jgi:hypothetical protein